MGEAVKRVSRDSPAKRLMMVVLDPAVLGNAAASPAFKKVVDGLQSVGYSCAMTNTEIVHDVDCEEAPGGKYDGLTMADGMPTPCHCVARAIGRARGERAAKRRKRA